MLFLCSGYVFSSLEWRGGWEGKTTTTTRSSWHSLLVSDPCGPPVLPQPHQLQTSINGPWGGVLALCKPAAQSCHLAGSQLTQLSFWGAISYRSTHRSIFMSSRGVVWAPLFEPGIHGCSDLLGSDHCLLSIFPTFLCQEW